MAGVQADAEALARRRRASSSARELLEGAPERAAGAGGVLEVQLAALALGERLARSSRRRARSPRRRRRSWPSRGAGPRRRRRSPRPTRSEWVSEASDFARMSAVVAGAVEQVDGVDQDGVDRARGHRLPERRDVLVAVGRRSPHARRLVEDLDRRGSRARRRARSPSAGRPRARRALRSACERIMRVRGTPRCSAVIGGSLRADTSVTPASSQRHRTTA